MFTSSPQDQRLDTDLEDLLDAVDGGGQQGVHLEVVVHVVCVPGCTCRRGYRLGGRAPHPPASAVSTLPTADSSDELNSRCCSMLQGCENPGPHTNSLPRFLKLLRVGGGGWQEGVRGEDALDTHIALDPVHQCFRNALKNHKQQTCS